MTLAIETCPAGFPVDEIYARLVAMGAGRSEGEARARLAALVLMLVNHIGDPDVVFSALDKIEEIFTTEGAGP